MDKSGAPKRVKELRDLLRAANDAYYQEANPIMSDQEYDVLMNELMDLEKKFDLYSPDSPTVRIGGEPTKVFPTVIHPVPLMSLSNTYSLEELDDFDRRVKDILEHDNFSYVAELKFDGMALRLRYEDGVLVLGATRGDGRQGDDITGNVRTIRDIPLKLKGKYPPIIEVRGEAYMERKAFVRFNNMREEEGEQVFANPRNATAGTMKLQDSRMVTRRPIRFFAYDLLLEEKDENRTQNDKIKLLESWGLPVCKYHDHCKHLNKVHKFIKYWDDKRHGLPYDTDGVVIKVNEERYRTRLGATAKSPRWAIAYKYNPEQAETTIHAITLQVGRLGTITPVAELEPVKLAGTTVKRASLHNEDEIHRKDIRPGDTVLIEKAGEIIPQVVQVVNSGRRDRSPAFHMPDLCPSCEEKLVRLDDEVAYRCINPSCPPQVRSRIQHFASRDALDIEGLGEAVVDQLVSHELIHNYAELYDLSEDDLLPLERMGKKSAGNLISAIAASKKQPFERVLYGLGIRFVGQTVARDLARAFGSIDRIMNAEAEELTQVESIGPKIADSVCTHFRKDKNRELIEHLREKGLTLETSGEIRQSHVLEGITFVLTGTLPTYTRGEAEKLIRDNGGKTTGSVSRKTDYVLAGENPGSKYDKAKALDIEIISEDDFNRIIGIDKNPKD